ncbi:MAG: hydroxyacid dehydrogenase [Thaumarchaeota archaeon]|nr:hydroxyacid dehydrogenase [Nitrososphaerota archaeon]
MKRVKPRVAVVNSKSFGRFTDALTRLESRCSVDQIEVPKNVLEKELAEKLVGYHFIVASVTPRYGEEFFKNNVDVVMIVRHGIGLDNIDLKAAEKHGVKIVAVPGYREREAVAEHALALMLSALRRIVEANDSVRKGGWHERAKFVGRNLSSLTVGVVGFGNIGSRVAEILRKGFGSRVIAYDPYVQEEKMRALGVVPVGSIAELMAESDIVTLHASLSPETYRIINRGNLMNARRGIILVNTARGELVDQDALAEALDKGVVSAVALDVVEKEPIELDHPLLKHGNVVITPHIAAYTRESLTAMDETIVEAIFNYLDKKPIEGIVVDPRESRNLML